MEIKIGIQHVARELVIESKESTEDVAKMISEALSAGKDLRLTDDKGRIVFVPTGSIGYVEIGVEEQRRVGFVAL